jgi:peptidoglycan/LPS O-acetylase OafA/YrhL
MTDGDAPTEGQNERVGASGDSSPGRATGVKPPAARLLQLDGLRGIAISLVVLYHYVTAAPATRNGVVAYLQAAFQMGWSGVDLFFVLSGFLIGGILLDAKASDRYFKTFYLRRIHRIFPIYYLWIGIYFLVVFTALVRWAGPLGIVSDRWTIIPVYALFVQNSAWSRGDAFRTPWLAALWSLAVEEQFYLVVPWIVRLASKRGLIVSLILGIFGAPVARMLVFKYIAPTHGAAPYVLTVCRADALAMGVLLAVGWRDALWRAWIQCHLGKLYVFLGLLSLGILYLMVAGKSPYSLAMSVWGYSVVDAFYAGVLVLALVAPKGIWSGICTWRPLIEIGGISYCVYIIHSVVNDVCHRALSSVPSGISTPSSFVATLIAVGITWLLAKTSWRYLEHPMIRLGHRYIY